MHWVKKGLCGISLKKHTYCVVSLDMVISIAMMVLGFVVILYPERYISHPDESFHHPQIEVQEVTERFTNQTTPDMSTAFNKSEVEHNEKEKIPTGAVEKDSDEDFHHSERLKDLQDEGVEVIITAMVTVVTTIMLVLGVRKNKSVFFVPWLAENVAGLVVAVGVSVIRLLSGTARSVPATIVGLVVIIPAYSYLVFGVASLYVMVRRMKQHSHQIISSVMQGSASYQDGVNVDRLPSVDEIGKEMQAFPANTATRMNDGVDRRDDVLYFSI